MAIAFDLCENFIDLVPLRLSTSFIRFLVALKKIENSESESMAKYFPSIEEQPL